MLNAWRNAWALHNRSIDMLSICLYRYASGSLTIFLSCRTLIILSPVNLHVCFSYVTCIQSLLFAVSRAWHLWPLTCAPAQTAEPPPLCQDSVSVPSALGVFSLSGRLRGSSVCEPLAHQTALHIPCQTGPLCLLHHWHCQCFLHHRCVPPRSVWWRWDQSPVSSGRNWWWSSWGKLAHLEKGEDLGRVEKGKFGVLTQSCTWDWELLMRRRMLTRTGADAGVAEDAV